MGRRWGANTSHEANAIRLAKSVRHLADEHGLPNKFRCSEVADSAPDAPGGARMTALAVGRLCTNHFTRPLVVARLADRGIKFVKIEKGDGASMLVVEVAA